MDCNVAPYENESDNLLHPRPVAATAIPLPSPVYSIEPRGIIHHPNAHRLENLHNKKSWVFAFQHCRLRLHEKKKKKKKTLLQ